VRTSYRGWIDGKGVTLFPSGSLDTAMFYPAWVLFVFALVAWIARRWLGAERRESGFCPACGYDLRATPARYPECGTIAAMNDLAKKPAGGWPEAGK
jgi:hypothetical protein